MTVTPDRASQSTARRKSALLATGPRLLFWKMPAWNKVAPRNSPAIAVPSDLPDQHRRDRGAVRGVGGRRLAGGEAALDDERPLQGGMVEIDGTVDDADADARADARAISLPADRCQDALPVAELAAAGARIGREIEWIVARDDRVWKFRRATVAAHPRRDAARRRRHHQRQPKRIEPLDAFEGEAAAIRCASREGEGLAIRMRLGRASSPIRPAMRDRPQMRRAPGI